MSKEPQLLAHAVDQILNRIRLLAREMCPSDREKLEMVLTEPLSRTLALN